MMRAGRCSRRGNAILEFTLVSIPLIFFIISIVELSRGMWIYTTLAHAIKKGTRYTAIHGAMCATASATCPVTIGGVAAVIHTNATGLDTSQLSVVLQSAHTTQNCSPLSACLGNSGAWPPATDNDVGQNVAITATYPYRSALSMFWPGAGAVRMGSFTLGAKAQEEISF